ncbi:MAG: glycosyl hydrolase family 65 protein, partial [Marmoricola sp.]
GYHDVALDYFLQALYVDLKNLHGNTVDGLHVASTGGVWSALVFGFGGMRDRGGKLSFDPRLPSAWPSMRFPITWRGTRMRVELTQDELAITVESVGEPEVLLVVRGEQHVVTANSPLRVPLAHQGDRIDGLLGDKPILGGTRADGTKITAGVPEPIAFEELGNDDFEAPDALPAGPQIAQS